MVKSYQMVPFNLVTSSPLPLLVTINLMGIIIAIGSGLSTQWHLKLIGFSVFSLLLSLFIWGHDITVEGSLIGSHTTKVQFAINQAFILFILSEIALFLSLFWSFLHCTFSPSVEVGLIWPIEAVSPLEIPLLGSALLFSSSISITVSDYAHLARDRFLAIYYLLITIIKGIYFTFLQLFEYSFSPFSADSLFGSLFYLATGLHGTHIIIGTLLLTISLLITLAYFNTDRTKTGFKLSIIYWHFVDVLWAFIYALFYLWPFFNTR